MMNNQLVVANPILSLFTRLLAIPSLSGHEAKFADAVQRHLDSLGYQSEKDPMGNVLVRVSGVKASGPTVCLAAHMDEIGMIVSAIGDDGALRVERSGGLYPWKLGEGPVEILGDQRVLNGVLSMGSTHTARAAEQNVTWANVKVLTGLSQDALAEAGVRPGTPVLPHSSVRGPVYFGPEDDPLIGAWTMDDRMGVVALLQMLETLKSDNIQPQLPLLVAFTIHEEGGGHGAKALAMREQPEIFVAVDGCPIPPGAPLKLDGRPGIWVKDRLAVYDPGLVRAFLRAGKAAGTDVQTVAYDSAASDASLVYAAGGTYRAACFGHVRENSHGYEVARISTFGHIVNTLVRFVETFEG
jgi:putative aminopeptidase FrvX